MLELHFPREHAYALFMANTHRECDPTIHRWVVETYARMRLSTDVARRRGDHCVALPGEDRFVDPAGGYWFCDDAGFEALGDAVRWSSRKGL